MRRVALVLALLLVPVPPTSAAAAPSPPAVEDAYRSVLDRVAFNVEGAAQATDPNASLIRSARDALDRAQAAVEEQRWRHARDAAADALVLATFVEARDAAEGSSDTGRALRSQAETERRTTQGLVDELGAGLDRLVEEGVDLRQADRAMLVAELVASASDRLDRFDQQLRGWPDDPPRRPGPFHAAVGARVPAWLAIELSRGLTDLGAEPIGPVVGERVAGTVSEALVPLMANVSRGSTPDALDRVRELNRAGSPMLAIGEALAWARTAPAARANLSSPAADGQLITDRLADALGQPGALGPLERTDLGPLQVSVALGDANASLADARAHLDANRSGEATGAALSGLGALSSARLGGAVLRGLAGLGGTRDVVLLADGTAGDFDVAERDTGFAPETEASGFALQAAVFAGAATVVVVAAALVRRYANRASR